MYFLSIDFGTSAVKISITDETGKAIHWAKQDYPYILLPGEKVELAPDVLWDAVKTASGRLPEELRQKVECICYDTFSPSPVLMDANGDLVYPNIITHLDRRSRAQSSYIRDHIGCDEYMKISGIYPFAGGCSAMTLLWFVQNDPSTLRRTSFIGHLPTYIHKKLTGLWMTDLVNASMIGLYNTTTQSGWATDLMRDLGLNPSCFTDIYQPGVMHGFLLPEMAQLLGVPSGIPVTIGTNDIAAAQMGAGNDHSGQIMNAAGSSEMVSILTDVPATNPKYYLRNSALPGIWQIYSTTSGGFSVDWFYKEFCREMDPDVYYNQYLVESIEAMEPGTQVTFDPYLTGDRQSLEPRTGAWHGLTLAATRSQMLAAMLKSMQDVLHTTLQQAQEVIRLDNTIKISGGLVTPAYLKLKKMSMPEFSFQEVDDCPIRGNVALYNRYA